MFLATMGGTSVSAFDSVVIRAAVCPLLSEGTNKLAEVISYRDLANVSVSTRFHPNID